MSNEGTTPTVVGQTTSSGIIDPGNPLFLHASDAPGMNLVNNIFDGRGYQGWIRSVLIALSAKNKLGFIDGSCIEPQNTAPTFSSWHRCNDMVTSWLLNSLSTDIAHSVIYSRTAKDLWKDLEQRFGQSNGAKLYHLHQEVSSYLHHHHLSCSWLSLAYPVRNFLMVAGQSAASSLTGLALLFVLLVLIESPAFSFLDDSSSHNLPAKASEKLLFGLIIVHNDLNIISRSEEKDVCVAKRWANCGCNIR